MSENGLDETKENATMRICTENEENPSEIIRVFLRSHVSSLEFRKSLKLISKYIGKQNPNKEVRNSTHAAQKWAFPCMISHWDSIFALWIGL